MWIPKTNAVDWEGDGREGKCVLLEQTRLPSQETYLRLSQYRDVVDAIKRLAVRGAPAIGVAGAYAVVLAAREVLSQPEAARLDLFGAALKTIVSARPTAVNLRWGVERMRRHFEKAGGELTEAMVETLWDEAETIKEEDIQTNLRMAEIGASLFTKPVGVMTYCNTGDLATAGIGTAFGVFHWAFRQGKIEHVYPCETRPVMQGMRLTVWELQRNEIPFTLICDNMAAILMREGKIGAVLTGADRVAANGDSANKVGTYTLAVLAKHHQIPFYIVAPTSTFDLSIPSGAEIPIEERDGEELLGALGSNRHDFKVPVRNPSFDVTPRELITAIVCEKGIIRSPSTAEVARVVQSKTEER